MTCKLNKPEVNYYNASILVNTQYGRSLTSPSKFIVSPDDILYNYQTHASKLTLVSILNLDKCLHFIT